MTHERGAAGRAAPTACRPPLPSALREVDPVPVGFDVPPGAITIEDAEARRPTLVAVMLAMEIGAIALVPALAYLVRPFLPGRLDKDAAPDDDAAPLP